MIYRVVCYLALVRDTEKISIIESEGNNGPYHFAKAFVLKYRIDVIATPGCFNIAID
jgi:hypothetical protein